MALINCPNCGKEISDRGKICPYCKLWLNEKQLADMQEELVAEGVRQYHETREYKQGEGRFDKLPPCPICGSKEHVKRISTLNRMTSVWAFGLASSKIGKQYECTHCKHKF